MTIAGNGGVTEKQRFDALAPIVEVFDRGKALTCVAMLVASGIMIDIAGEYELSVSADIVVLGVFAFACRGNNYLSTSSL